MFICAQGDQAPVHQVTLFAGSVRAHELGSKFQYPGHDTNVRVLDVEVQRTRDRVVTGCDRFKFGRLAVESVSAAQAGAAPAAVQSRAYLADAFDTIRQHPIVGVGYVPDAKAGDSMVVHLLVTCGAIGAACFVLLILNLGLLLLQSLRIAPPEQQPLHHAFLIVFMAYAAFSITFPTFIQDRSADIFWWMGSILALNTRPLREIIAWRCVSIVT